MFERVPCSLKRGIVFERVPCWEQKPEIYFENNQVATTTALIVTRVYLVYRN